MVTAKDGIDRFRPTREWLFLRLYHSVGDYRIATLSDWCSLFALLGSEVESTEIVQVDIYCCDSVVVGGREPPDMGGITLACVPIRYASFRVSNQPLHQFVHMARSWSKESEVILLKYHHLIVRFPKFAKGMVDHWEIDCDIPERIAGAKSCLHRSADCGVVLLSFLLEQSCFRLLLLELSIDSCFFSLRSLSEYRNPDSHEYAGTGNDRSQNRYCVRNRRRSTHCELKIALELADRQEGDS